MLTPLNVRVEKKLLKDLERFAQEQNLDKAAFLREVIRKGFEDAKQQLVLRCYGKKELSIGEACRRLRMNRWEFFELLKAHNQYLNLDLEDLLTSSRLSE